MAGVAGLEPVTSAVTGQRSNQLSYTPAPGRPENKERPRSSQRVIWVAFVPLFRASISPECGSIPTGKIRSGNQFRRPHRALFCAGVIPSLRVAKMYRPIRGHLLIIQPLWLRRIQLWYFLALGGATADRWRAC